MKTITVRASVDVPKVPNYLIIDSDHKLSIADVPDDELKYIGQAWTEALIERAAEIRLSNNPAHS
jgi:hypothetical protein